MKSFILSVALLITTVNYAQKDELKLLKKLFSKEQISQEDLMAYKTASDKLNSIAVAESDKIYAKMYKAVYPIVELSAKNETLTIEDQAKLMNDPDFLATFGLVADEVVAFENKSGKQLHSEKLIDEKNKLNNNLYSSAFKLYEKQQFREASIMFHNLYVLNPKLNGFALENSAQLAAQAGDYPLADRFYEDMRDSGYLEGMEYYATEKVSGKEEKFTSKESRDNLVKIGSYIAPRELSLSTKKPEVYKMIALIASQNGNIDKAKRAFDEAKKFEANKTDKQLIQGEFNMYYNLGYDILKEDKNIVDEINKNLEPENKVKYEELMNKRKGIFNKALPYIEKAYSIDATDSNVIKLLKISYGVLEMKEKLEKLQ